MMATHDDLQRSLGRVEGEQDAMRDRMDQLEGVVEKGFARVGASLEAINARLAGIDANESERRGASRVYVGAASMISGFIGAVATWWLKSGAS